MSCNKRLWVFNLTGLWAFEPDHDAILSLLSLNYEHWPWGKWDILRYRSGSWFFGEVVDALFDSSTAPGKVHHISSILWIMAVSVAFWSQSALQMKL